VKSLLIVMYIFVPNGYSSITFTVSGFKDMAHCESQRYSAAKETDLMESDNRFFTKPKAQTRCVDLSAK